MAMLHFWICTKLIKSSFIKEEPVQYNILFNAFHGYVLICPDIHDCHALFAFLFGGVNFGDSKVHWLELENWWLNCSNDASIRHTTLLQQTTKETSTTVIIRTGGLPNIWDLSERSVLHTLGAKLVCHNPETAPYGYTVIIVLFA